MWIAHKNEDGQREQSILEHLKGTANRAQEFANPFGCGEYGRCLGMLHDIGKYSEGFRERILNGGGKVDHSTAGAQLVWELSNTLNARIASYCVAGHHTGLPDGGSAADHEAESTLSARLQRPVEDYQAFRQEIDPSTLLPTQEPPLRLLGKRALPFLSLLECFTPAWWTPIFSTRSASCPTAASRATRGNRFPYCVANWHNI